MYKVKNALNKLMLSTISNREIAIKFLKNLINLKNYKVIEESYSAYNNLRDKEDYYKLVLLKEPFIFTTFFISPRGAVDVEVGVYPFSDNEAEYSWYGSKVPILKYLRENYPVGTETTPSKGYDYSMLWYEPKTYGTWVIGYGLDYDKLNVNEPLKTAEKGYDIIRKQILNTFKNNINVYKELESIIPDKFN